MTQLRQKICNYRPVTVLGPSQQTSCKMHLVVDKWWVVLKINPLVVSLFFNIMNFIIENFNCQVPEEPIYHEEQKLYKS